jgi:hypothetical protein
MTQPNRVAIALSTMIAGAAAGTAVATVFVWLSWRGWGFLSVFGDPRNLVFAGNFVFAPVTAFLIAWPRLMSIDETWRRAAMSVTAAFGALGGAWGAFGASMMAMFTMSPLISNGLVPGYLAVAALVAFVALRISRKHRAAAGA